VAVVSLSGGDRRVRGVWLADMERMGVDALAVMRKIEEATLLDPATNRLIRVADRLSRSTALRQLLTGAWLGHSLHPLLTDFTEGAWMAASFLDIFGPPGSSRAARRLLAFGLMMAAPTYLTGLADWTQAEDESEQRVGLVHLTTTSLAVALYAGSYLARVRSKDQPATLLGLAGGLVALVDGYLAGHLAHVRGLGVGETVSTPQVFPDLLPPSSA
jgi:uncharacterized membrane protein